MTILHVKSGLSQPKRYTFLSKKISIFSRKFHNSLTASILQKPRNLAPFCEEKIFCAENRPSRASFVVNVSNCNFDSSTGAVQSDHRTGARFVKGGNAGIFCHPFRVQNMGGSFHTGAHAPAYSYVVPLSPYAYRTPFSSELRPSGRTALLRSMTFGSGLFLFSSITASSEFSLSQLFLMLKR